MNNILYIKSILINISSIKMPQYFYTTLSLDSEESLPHELLETIFGSGNDIRSIKHFKLYTGNHLVNAWLHYSDSFTIKYDGLEKPNLEWISQLSKDFQLVTFNFSWYNENLEEAGEIKAESGIIKEKNYYGSCARNYCADNHDVFSSILINKHVDLESGELFWIEEDIYDNDFNQDSCGIMISDIEYRKNNYVTDWNIITC